MSGGFTPDIRAACPKVSGRTRLSFSRASRRIAAIQLVLSAGSQVVALDVRNMSYGDFQGYDIDGQETADYSAGDLLVRNFLIYLP